MKRFIFGLLALGLVGPAYAQVAPPTPPPVSVLSGQVSLSVSNVSSRVALPSSAASAISVTVYNSGTNDAYIATGTVAIVATSGGTCAAGTSGPSCRIPAGASISFYTRDAYLAAITASSTTTLVIYQGTGPLALRIFGAPNGAAPTGPAGGDLAGTYPNPTVANLSGVTNSSLPNSGLANPSMTIAGHSVALGGTQALACADLSNGATGCSTATGTSGATLPLLNGTNTWSVAQTFSSGIQASNGLLGVGSFSAAPIYLGVHGLTVLTAGSPADLGTITIPAGITRWRPCGSNSNSDPFVNIVARTFTATQGAATFRIFDQASGAGSELTNGGAVGPTASSAVVGGIASNNALETGVTTVYVRQTVNSANSGTDDFYIKVCPLL